MSEQNAINKTAEDFLIRKSVGDPFVHFELTGTQDYSIGIDDSDGNKLKLTDGVDPSLGNEFLAIKTTGDITFNGAYEFPITDGTAGYVLTTDGAGNVDWQLNSASGKTIQQVRVLTTTQTATAAVIPFDNTIPQQTEGAEIFTLAITPTSASNILIIDFSGYLTGSTQGTTALFQDATANALFARAFGGGRSFRYYMTAGTTSSTTFKIRYGAPLAGTVFLNRDLNGNRYGGVAQTNMTITEITP